MILVVLAFLVIYVVPFLAVLYLGWITVRGRARPRPVDLTSLTRLQQEAARKRKK